MKKIKEDSIEFMALTAELAINAMQIKQCRKCGGPVNDGHCCGRCGSGDGAIEIGTHMLGDGIADLIREIGEK